MSDSVFFVSSYILVLRFCSKIGPKISNILSMADEVTISKHEYPKVLFTWRWSLFLGNNDVVFSLNGYPQETKVAVEDPKLGPEVW